MQNAPPSDPSSHQSLDRVSSPVAALVRGRHPSSMVDEPGWLARALLGWLLASVRFDVRSTDVIRDAHTQGSVVHVMRSRSVIDYVYLNLVFLARGLPLVRFANGIRTWFLRNAFSGTASLLRGRRRLPPDEECLELLVETHTPVMLFLHRPTFRSRQTDFAIPLLQRLIGISRRRERPVLLLPELILWDKRPDRVEPTLLDSVFGSRQSPGFFRSALYVLQNFWQSFLQLGEPTAQVSPPLNLRDFVADHPDRSDEQLALLLYDRLLGIFDREQRVVVGPDIKAAKVMREEILADTRTETAMAAAEPELPLVETKRRARRLLKEIAANFDLLGIKFLSALLTPVWNLIYDGIELDYEGLEKVRRTAIQKRLVIVPSHKSHIDYLLISYLFYRNGLIPPHIAAGVNLSFWPLGPIFRLCGAFFLRRTFVGDPLYASLFNAYLVKLLEEGFSIEFFIEGTRSRTGKLNAPKYGMMNMIVDAWQGGDVEGLAFIPVSVGYENIIEGSSYRQELEGGEKKGESIGGLLSSLQVLTSRYGRVYVEFGEPIDLGNFLAGYHGDPKPHIPRPDMERSVRRLAYRIIHGINEVTTVTPSGLAALVLLNAPSGFMDRAVMARDLGFVLAFLRVKSARLSSTLSTQLVSQLAQIHGQHLSTPDLSRFDDFDQEFLSTTAANRSLDLQRSAPPIVQADDALGEAVLPLVSSALDLLARKGLVEKVGVEQAHRWSVPANRRIELDFYKNNLLHYFVAEAVFATALYVTPGAQRSIAAVKEHARLLSSMLKYEFCFEERSRFDEVFGRSADYFAERGWLATSADGEHFEVLDDGTAGAEFLRGLLLPIVEAYRIAALTLPEIGTDQVDPKQLAKRAITIGTQLRTRGEIVHPEAVSKAAFDNAGRIFRELNLLQEHTVESGRKKTRLVSLSDHARNGGLDAFARSLETMVAQQERTAGALLRTR